LRSKEGSPWATGGGLLTDQTAESQPMRAHGSVGGLSDYERRGGCLNVVASEEVETDSKFYLSPFIDKIFTKAKLNLENHNGCSAKPTAHPLSTRIRYLRRIVNKQETRST
jgi:hypothetical protein